MYDFLLTSLKLDSMWDVGEGNNAIRLLYNKNLYIYSKKVKVKT